MRAEAHRQHLKAYGADSIRLSYHSSCILLQEVSSTKPWQPEPQAHPCVTLTYGRPDFQAILKGVQVRTCLHLCSRLHLCQRPLALSQGRADVSRLHRLWCTVNGISGEADGHASACKDTAHLHMLLFGVYAALSVTESSHDWS